MGSSKLIFFIFSALPLIAHASIFEGEVSTPTRVHHLLQGDIKIITEVGLEYHHPNLVAFKNIVVENPTNSTQTSPQYGNVAADYPDQFFQTLIFQALLNEKNKFTIALKTELPLNTLASLDTGSIFLPEYVRARSDFQRPQIFIFSGMNVNEDLRVGLGVELGFKTQANANVFLQSGANKYSDQRVSVQVKPTFTPWVGFEYQKTSLTIRSENKTTVDLNTIAAARVFGSVSAGINFNYTSSSTLFYQPWSFELQRAFEFNEEFKLLPSLSYQLWSHYQAPAAIIQNEVSNNCNGQAGCTATFSAGRGPDFRAQDLLVPAVGLEWASAPDLTLLAGYRYQSGIFKDLPTGFGNYLDPPRHDLLVGFRHSFASGVEFGMNLQVSRLVSQTVVKLDSSEMGATQPVTEGYEASGWLYGGGINVAIPFH